MMLVSIAHKGMSFTGEDGQAVPQQVIVAVPLKHAKRAY
jgi:hypothetical protein